MLVAARFDNDGTPTFNQANMFLRPSRGRNRQPREPIPLLCLNKDSNQRNIVHLLSLQIQTPTKVTKSGFDGLDRNTNQTNEIEVIR
jgi:hypothetical protein